MIRFPIIAKSYKQYKTLLSEKKVATDSSILLGEKRNNKTRLIGNSELLGGNNSNVNASLFVEASRDRLENCGFKINVKEFAESPCFRYDNDGPAHTDSRSDKPLLERRVTTPHFHMVDESGWEIAYKTKQLQNDEALRAIQGDINLALSHFCNEANIRCGGDVVPTAQPRTPEFSLSDKSDDPLANIGF